MAVTHSASLVAVPDNQDATQQRLASSITALLDILGTQQVELAEQVGMTQPALNKSLNGKRNFKLAEAERIADALHAPFQLLLVGGEEIRNKARAAVFASLEPNPEGGPGLRNPGSAWNENVVDLGARFATRGTPQVQPPLPFKRTA